MPQFKTQRLLQVIMSFSCYLSVLQLVVLRITSALLVSTLVSALSHPSAHCHIQQSSDLIIQFKWSAER